MLSVSEVKKQIYSLPPKYVMEYVKRVSEKALVEKNMNVILYIGDNMADIEDRISGNVPENDYDHKRIIESYIGEGRPFDSYLVKETKRALKNNHSETILLLIQWYDYIIIKMMKD